MSFLNRCIWNPTAGGLTDFVVASAFTGAYAPAQCLDPAVIDGGTYHYFAATPDNTQHEEGDGVYSVATSTLTRALIRNSSNGGAKVNFGTVPVVTMGGPVALDIVPVYLAATHTLQFDALDSATPNAQTIQAQSVLTGTSNTSAPNFNINAGYSTGLGTPGQFNLNTGYQGIDSPKPLSSISNGSPAVFNTTVPHNIQGGQCILLSTTGTLPAPLATFTDYFVDGASLGVSTFEVAADLNATVINTTSAGSGTHSYVYGGTVATIVANILFTSLVNTSLMEGMPVQFITTGTLPSAIAPSTTYYVENLEFLSFQIAATPGGAIIPVANDGTGTLAYVVMANDTTQNRIPPNKNNFSVGSGGLFGNDVSALFKINQIWNTAGFSYGIHPGGPRGGDISLGITNIRSRIQGTRFIRFSPDNQPLNVFSIWATPSNQTNAWRLDAGGGVGTFAPFIEMTGNGNGDPSPISICATPLNIADTSGNNKTSLSVEGTAGVLSVLNNTPTSPSALRAYNTIDVSFGTPTNYERVAADFTTTANVGTIGTQAGGTGTVRDFAIVKGTNTFLTSATATVGTLPAAAAGLTGARRFVTDSNQTLTAGIGAIVATGGANVVPVFCDGTNWRIG